MIHFLLVIGIVGFLVFILLQIPMPQIFRTIILGIVTIVLVVWVLQVFGVSTGFSRLRL